MTVFIPKDRNSVRWERMENMEGVVPVIDSKAGQVGQVGSTRFLANVPEGYDTVWGFLAKEEPHLFGLMLDPVFSLFEDQDRAKMVAGLLGHDYLPVSSPPALLESGVPEVFAFTREVLLVVFPANP